jgi:NAD(P)-dependent dehydrogenase (short-subunit alcohol dehydrogenase family)
MIRSDGDMNGGSVVAEHPQWEDRRMDLTTKCAVVTGGARGIGRATCMALAREGIKAIAVVDQTDGLGEITDDLNNHYKREVMVPFVGDVTDAEFRKQVFVSMSDQFGPVSVCVPAAGITRDRLAAKFDRESGEVSIYPEQDWDRVIEVDLKAPVYWAIETIATVAADRKKRGLKGWVPDERAQGCIVFIGSVSSSGNRGQVSYATAKAGLEGAEATLSLEAIYHGVRCGIIHPGYTDTAMVRALGEDFIKDRILPQTQLKRLVLPEEIADAICFMIRNSAVSGRLWADAGWHPSA